jgi:hypothetical protein
MHAMSKAQQKPWYREPWVWLMIAFPMTAVIGGMITIYLAVSSADGLVVDDYYKRGKAINLDLARDEAAARYGVEASLELGIDGDTVSLKLGAINGTWPEIVRLSLLHPTRSGHDQALTLRHTGEGGYRTAIDGLAQGHWYVQLEADDWRLSGTLSVPQAEPLVLAPIL